ncbi:Fc.00g045520.m01.CDS01 [Cosmosporella sp. VM-42]
MWNDLTLQAAIRDLLGPCADDFNALCLALNEKLIGISRELDQIFGDHSGRSKRLRFSVKPKHLDQQLRDARRIREQLEKLVLEVSLPQVGTGIPKGFGTRKTLKNFEKAREHASLLRQVLSMGNAADLNIAIYPMAGTAGGSVSTFTLLFRQNTFEPASPFGWRRATVEISPMAKLPSQDPLGGNVPNESQNSQSQANLPRVRFMHFKDNPPNPTRVAEGGPEVIWADTPEELGRHFSEAEYHTDHRATVCLRYPPFVSLISVTFRCCEKLHKVSLKDLLKIDPGIPKLARLALVVGLARAVLLFHETGFMHETLKSGSVWFTRDSNEILLGNLLLPAEAPNFQRTEKHYLKEPNALANFGTSFGRVSAMLGIILVEVLLLREVSPRNERADVLSPGTLADALDALNDISILWGHSCSDAVRQCLVGFGFTTDEKREQELFLDRVLKPLEEVLRYFSPVTSATNAKLVLVRDWDRALYASKDPVFPVELTDKSIQMSPLRDPTAFRVFRDYIGSMRTSCEGIPWLDEALSTEARNFDEVLRQLDQRSQSIASDSPNVERIETLIRHCLRGISTIPQIYELEAQSSPSRKALEKLQIQLRVGTLELSSLLADIQAPSSPALSSSASASGADSIFDGDSFTLSSRTSVSGNDDIDLQYMDSRGLAGEILRSLRVVLDPKPFPRGGLMVNDPDLSSKLRQILGSYCAEIQSTHQQDTSFPQPSQSPFYQKAHSMVLKEIEFLLEQLISICRGDTDLGMIQLPPESIARAQDAEVEMVPAFVVMDFLMGGKAFGRLRLRIRRLVQQDTMQIISDEVLRNLPLTTPGLYSALVHVRWDLSDHIMNELDGSTDISQVLTLTGGSSHAYASRCADYLKWLWGDSKYEICSHLQHYLEQKIYEHPDSTLMINQHTEGQNGITVTVIGAKETITAVAQQLAWLTAAFRSCPSGAALSDVDFIATKGMEFFIEPGALTKLSNVTAEQDTCWHRLVRNAAIAHAFPIPPRSDQVGLELPFTAMLKLSRASSFLIANQRLAFYGFSSFLFPMDQCPDITDDDDQARQSIQWHFETSDEPYQYFDCADYLAESKCMWANSVDQRTLTTSRHFVGFCRVAEFRLATSNSDCMNLLESPLPEASTTVGARIENVTLGTGGLGFATAEFESNIKYAHSIVSPVAPDEYLGTLDTTKRMSMILWDCGDQCGWLVPAQALLLHMAHVWVRSNGISVTFRYANEGASYLQEVDDILRTDRKKVLRAHGRDDDTDFELRHLIMRLWNDIRGCMLAQQSAIRDDKGVIGYQSGAISGWELIDFITRPPLEFSMKQDKRGPSDDSWKALAAEKNIPVLFCQGAGDVIKTTGSGFLCANCRLPLKQECHLVASLTCLGHMAQKYGGFRTRTKLTTEWGWQPTDEAALFGEHCQPDVGSRCHERLQKLITVKDGQQGTNLGLPATGAVVFGRPGSKASKSTVAAAGQPPSGTVVPTTPVPALVKKGKLKKWWAKWGRNKWHTERR